MGSQMIRGTGQRGRCPQRHVSSVTCGGDPSPEIRKAEKPSGPQRPEFPGQGVGVGWQDWPGGVGGGISVPPRASTCHLSAM